MQKSKFILLVFLFLAASSASLLNAKDIEVRVASAEDKAPVPGAIVSVIAGDSIAMTSQAGKDGRLSFAADDSAGTDILLIASALGFMDAEARVNARQHEAPLTIFLKKDSVVSLSEVVVSADRSHAVKRTANGEIFFLSGKARKERNPFLALSEIPLLISDYTTSSIKLLDGKQPLVLIDGNQANSGISPLSPSDIESVEVITTVPARYLQDGYSGIVNIRLKKNRPPYVWFGGSYGKTFPSAAIEGPSARFEIGNEKLSVYGSAIYFYTRDAKSVSDVRRSNDGYEQDFRSEERSRSDDFYGWLMLKYIASPKDYLAANIRYNSLRHESESSATGELVTDTAMDYAADGASDNRNSMLSANLYYKHSFSDYNDLELNAGFSTDNNRMNSENSETVGQETSDYISAFRNSRRSGYFYADYARTLDNGGSFSVGSHAKITKDRIGQVSSANPAFHARTVSEYMYGAFGGELDKLLYNLSAGLEYIRLSAADARSSYFRPRVSTSGTWSFTRSSSVKLAYTLTNQAPSIAMLNPLNTSTDPLVVSSGNPSLKPVSEHELDLTYTFNKNGWYISPGASYCISRDLISPWGYTENGVFHNTYRNAGHCSEMDCLLNVSYNSAWLSLTAASGPCAQYFEGRPAKWSSRTYLSIFARVKKIYIIAELQHATREYTDISSTKYHSPMQSRLHISYNFSPDFFVAVGVYNFSGDIKTTTRLSQGTFNSVTRNYNKGDGRGFLPYVRVYYNFRKNNKRKINFSNPNFEEEKGIRLK